jgi:RNA polymerase sigma-70 factor (ECF subfamily)
MIDQRLIPHLFRTEFRKIAAVLCKLLGVENIQIAEDIASETFLLALETWPYKGIPENPPAWLYAVAKNKTHNHLARTATFNKVATTLKNDSSSIDTSEIDLSEKNINDSQLQMLFALSNPAIPTEVQVGLSLRILCGFGIDEIAKAFLTNKETINKRLFRGRETLRINKVKIEFPENESLNDRLQTVLTTLYLLFNEGYYSETNDQILRKDLCFEAIRLTQMLVDNHDTNTPAVRALLALMYFHASRFKARKNEKDEMILYHDQDETMWDKELISQGAFYLHSSSGGKILSKYHLEAAIAYWHTIKEDTTEKWENILQLYNHLLQLSYSSIAALNRTYALSKIKGKKVAITEAEKLKLNDNHYYFTLLGELYSDVDKEKAIQNFSRAHDLARTPADKQTIKKRLDLL